MTTISATIISDSLSPSGSRLTTMQLRYPYWIHGELMTHRVLSRNASSNRAIPVKRMIEWIRQDPAVPLYWGKNIKGMKALEECNELVTLGPNNAIPYNSWKREDAWKVALESAIETAEAFDEAGYHKQIVNRLLMPFMHMNTLVTSTKWENFFALRDHPDAEPHICHLAQTMRKAMAESEPRKLALGEWHLPYIEFSYSTGEWSDNAAVWAAIRCSVARCARVSYMTAEGKQPTVKDDLQLYDRLVGSQPIHASPAEHQATLATTNVSDICRLVGTPHPWPWPTHVTNRFNGNFSHPWIQFRKLLPNEDLDQ